MSDNLPTNPAERKIVVVLDEDDYLSCDYDDTGRELLTNPEVSVQPFPVRGDDERLLNLQREGLLRPGAVLLQSPYDGSLYADVGDAEDSFAVQKYMLFSSVCMQLGATEIRVERIMVRDESGEVEVNVGGDRLGAKADVNAKREKAEKICSQISLVDKFEGGAPNVDAAADLMRRAGLMSNPNLRSLLEMAKVENNRITSRRFQLDLTSEVKKRLELAMSLGVPGVVRVGGDLDVKSRENIEYKVTVAVDF